MRADAVVSGAARLALPLLLAAVLTGCATVQRWLPPLAPAAERLARSVTIVRDEWGVPTIYAPTDAGVVFGSAWAQAEDNYWQVEEEYIHALGWASAWYGERYLAADLVRGAFEVVRLSREEYEREPAERRVLWDAFAAGLNHYVRVSGTQPRVIARWEPWMVFARFRQATALTSIDGVRLGDILTVAQRVAEGGSLLPPAQTGAAAGAGLDTAAGVATGAAMWAVTPARTAAGHALLLQNRHGDFSASGHGYELHLHSGSGWQVRGFAMTGTPIPQAGHTAHHAWAHTPSGADHADAWDIVFDHPSETWSYGFDGEWRAAVEWDHAMYVNTPTGVERRTYRLRRTRHGPVVQREEGRGRAVRVARMEDGGALQQWHELSRAHDLDAFMQALDRRALTDVNTMYADVAGNILYLHGNAVPRRDASRDWSRPVDGGTSATEWRGYHELHELPLLLNPAAGWLQNTSSMPFRATAQGNLDAADYPAYMAPDADNERAASSRRLLAGDSAWTFDAWARAAFDTYVTSAEDALRHLIHDWEDVGGRQPLRAMRIDEAVDLLRSWDRRSSIESPEMTLFVLWQERLRAGGYTGEYVHFRAMEDAVEQLRREAGTAVVAWGDINRLQRVHATGESSFDADAVSLPVPGAPAWTGAIFAFQAPPGPRGLRFGTSGSAWVSVVELGAQVRSRSVLPFGQSTDPASPHWFDQAPFYARGELKPVWFAREDVMANARRVYSPGADALR
jgi:acyl-homoserine-lactone acylase